MYMFTWVFGSIRQYFTFTDCLFFGAIISSTDPSKTNDYYKNKKQKKKLKNVPKSQLDLFQLLKWIFKTKILVYLNSYNIGDFPWPKSQRQHIRARVRRECPQRRGFNHISPVKYHLFFIFYH